MHVHVGRRTGAVRQLRSNDPGIAVPGTSVATLTVRVRVRARVLARPAAAAAAAAAALCALSLFLLFPTTLLRTAFVLRLYRGWMLPAVKAASDEQHPTC